MTEPTRDPVAETREQLAYLIRAELVCCDIYNKINNVEDCDDSGAACDKTHVQRRRAAKADGSWHDICYYGEWAARLCLNGELPPFPLIYTDSISDTEWEEILVHPGPVRERTVYPKVGRRKRIKEKPDA